MVAGGLLAVIFLTLPACTQSGTSNGLKASPSGSAAGPPRACRTTDLQLSLLGIAGPGAAASFEYRNSSTITCIIRGYVTIELLDKNGDKIPARAINEPGIPPSDVALPPGTQPLPSTFVLEELAGHAKFEMVWEDPCPSGTALVPSRLKITPPNNTDSVTVNVASVRICDSWFVVYAVRPTRP